MNTLIAYSSKYGATRDCAERIAKKLPGNTMLHNLDETITVDLSPYDHVVVGCSVYMSKPRKAARQFCEKNLQALKEKKVGLFLCCIQDVDKNVAQQFDLAFPKELREAAVVLGQLGGTVDFTKLKAFDKVIMNMVAGDLRKKTNSDIVSTLSDERIDRFCHLLQFPEPKKEPEKKK